ncbi:hypothetical protein HDU97_008156 [Phlyctochytrium planicorne]|nr:hypothetical protein HDU97_008156 [Phlyctochytrium planicorne]
MYLTDLPPEVLYTICRIALGSQRWASGVYSLMLASRMTFYVASKILWADIDGHYGVCDLVPAKLQSQMLAFERMATKRSTGTGNQASTSRFTRMAHYLSSIRTIRQRENILPSLLPYMTGLQEIYGTHSFLSSQTDLQSHHLQTGRPYRFKYLHGKYDQLSCGFYPKAQSMSGVCLPGWETLFSLPRMDMLHELRLSVNVIRSQSRDVTQHLVHVGSNCPNLRILRVSGNYDIADASALAAFGKIESLNISLVSFKGSIPSMPHLQTLAFHNVSMAPTTSKSFLQFLTTAKTLTILRLCNVRTQNHSEFHTSALASVRSHPHLKDIKFFQSFLMEDIPVHLETTFAPPSLERISIYRFALSDVTVDCIIGSLPASIRSFDARCLVGDEAKARILQVAQDREAFPWWKMVWVTEFRDEEIWEEVLKKCTRDIKYRVGVIGRGLNEFK